MILVFICGLEFRDFVLVVTVKGAIRIVGGVLFVRFECLELLEIVYFLYNYLFVPVSMMYSICEEYRD